MKSIDLPAYAWRDPAECVDQLRAEHERQAKAEKLAKERARTKKQRLRKRQLKAAKARQSKGQR